MRVVGHWWNGTWGRLARRDVWLKTDGNRWWVEARQGDGDRQPWRGRPHLTEEAARQELAAMLARAGKKWRDLTPPTGG